MSLLCPHPLTSGSLQLPGDGECPQHGLQAESPLCSQTRAAKSTSAEQVAPSLRDAPQCQGEQPTVMVTAKRKGCLSCNSPACPTRSPARWLKGWHVPPAMSPPLRSQCRSGYAVGERPPATRSCDSRQKPWGPGARKGHGFNPCGTLTRTHDNTEVGNR